MMVEQCSVLQWGHDIGVPWVEAAQPPPHEWILELSDLRWSHSDPTALTVTFGATLSQSDKRALGCSFLQKFILKQLLENFTIQKFHFPNSAVL